MVRKLCVLSICLAMLVTACKKKAEPPEPGPPPEPEVAAPGGMTKVPGTRPAVFISTKAVTVGEYLEFLGQTGQPVPPRLAAEQVSLGAPVEGLTLDEAQRYATWTMMRLPGASEWDKASKIVGDDAYPWGDELDPHEPRQAAKLFLVREWARGSEGEQKAEEKKQALVDAMLLQQMDQIAQMKERIGAATVAASTIVAQQWEEAKPNLFTALQQKKEHAELMAREELNSSVLDILRRKVGEEKQKLINLKVREALQTEIDEASEHYKKALADWREQIEENKRVLQEKNQQLQVRALELKQNIEALGGELSDRFEAETKDIAEQLAAEVSSLEMALSLREQLEASEDRLQKAEEASREALHRVTDSVVAGTEELETKIQKLKEQLTEQQGTISTVQESIKNLSTHIDKQFRDEAFLFQDLERLTAQSALKRALDAEIAELERTLKLFAGPEEMPGETPAEAPSEEPVEEVAEEPVQQPAPEPVEAQP